MRSRRHVFQSIPRHSVGCLLCMLQISFHEVQAAHSQVQSLEALQTRQPHYMTTLIMKHECRTMSVEHNKALNLTTGGAVLTNDCMCVCMFWVILQECSYRISSNRGLGLYLLQQDLCPGFETGLASNWGHPLLHFVLGLLHPVSFFFDFSPSILFLAAPSDYTIYGSSLRQL